MTEKGKRVVAGFMALGATDREEAYQKIREFYNADYAQKTNVRDRFQKSEGIIAGPVSGGCPCCGR